MRAYVSRTLVVMGFSTSTCAPAFLVLQRDTAERADPPFRFCRKPIGVSLRNLAPKVLVEQKPRVCTGA